MIINKKFICFSFINLIDKFLIFILPLSILFFFNDKKLYNDVEIIYTASMIFYIFADGGIKNYSLAYFRKAENKNKFINQKIKYVNSLIFYYLIIFFPLILIFYFKKQISIFFFLIFFRTLFLIYSNYFKVHFSLLKKQMNMLAFTLIASISTLFYLSFVFYSNKILSIEEFFIFQILTTSALVLLNLVNKKILKPFLVIKLFYKSIEFSLPLILNAFIFLIIMHFVKIYSYNYLSDNEMTKVSFLIRIMLSIQVCHGIFTNYFLRNFFETKLKKIDLKLILSYLFIILGAGGMLILFYPLLIKILNLNYKIDYLFALLFSYTVFWCLAAFLEQYLNKFHMNKYILLYSLISLVAYIVIIFFFKDVDMLVRICSAMTVSILIYFFLLIRKTYQLIKNA